jgi:hypothetical protein
MKNIEVKKHKEELRTITVGIKIRENDSMAQRLKKLDEGVKKLQDLADLVGASKYYGEALRDIDRLLAVEEGRKPGDYVDSVLKDRCAICEDIYKVIYGNIHYALQTEMMFNACISAKRSCVWAAVAAIAACISVIFTIWVTYLTMFSK